MKLIRVKIPQKRFRGLQEDFEIIFPVAERTVSTLYLAGQNGTGKSNLLELLSEIFFYLDSLNLEHGSETLFNDKEFAFEIEYKIKIHGGHLATNLFKEEFFHVEDKTKWVRVLITKTFNSKPVYNIISVTGSRFVVNDADYIEFSKERITQHILPQKIIGYSSGQNELLSNSFLKMRYHYFNEYIEMIALLEKEYDENENTDKSTSSKVGTNLIADSRLVLLDYRNNASVFIANALRAEIPKTESGKHVFEELLNITGLHSFRISINFESLASADESMIIKLRPELMGFIDKLKRCTPLFIDNEILLSENDAKLQRKILLDFFVDEVTRQAFEIEFPDAPKLFQLFYEMEILNIYAHPANIREIVRNAPKDLNISDEIPAISPDKLIFNVSAVYVTKSDLNYPIKYKNLSDGEHQFLQVVGALLMMRDDNFLFLLDEPGTHLNPAWAIQYFKFVELCKKEHGCSQILLTTHNPLMINSLGKNQIQFLIKNKLGNIESELLVDDPSIMNVDDILTSDIFGLQSTLSLDLQKDIYRRAVLIGNDNSSTAEHEELSKLNEKLSFLGFPNTFDDPIYNQFIKALLKRPEYQKPILSKKERQIQEDFANKILDEILNKENE
jgi:restriction system-associated AAA family ATPase